MAGGRGGRGRGVEKETRNRMMQNLFGNQPNDKDEDQVDGGDEVTGVNGNDRGSGGGAHHQQLRLLDLASANDEYSSDNGGHGLRGYQWEEGQGESHGSGGMAEESKGEAHHVELSNLRIQGDKKDMDMEEGSHDNFYADQDCKDEEAAQTRKSGPREDEKDHEVIRDVFDDGDEDEFVPYRGQDDTEDAHRLLIEDEGHCGNNLQSEDMVYDEDMHYESDGNFEHEPKEIPLGPPLNLVAPPMLPPGQRDRMNVIKVSNITGINPKPFNPETYVEEDAFTMDESEGKKRIHLEDNVVRWRIAKNANGTESYESNASFVKWKHGSTQLLIGNEVLDISVNESTHDHSHLFIRNGKGVLQSQGRLLQKMRFIPSSLCSRSHRLLIALVDYQNKRTIKMQTWYDTKDP